MDGSPTPSTPTMNSRDDDVTADASNREENVTRSTSFVDKTRTAPCVSERLPDLQSYAPQQQEHHHQQQQQQHDLLTIFQAAPLVYKSKKTDDFQTLALLDFDYERRELTKAIEEASVSGDGSRKVDVDFQIATVDRMGYFLAREQGQTMHFSCHGNPTYLALEDGRGALQTLRPDELKEWIALGGKNLHFVFVSACHSSFIGQAFVDAGVPHVVCCRHDSAILESSSVEFEKIFYRNLACGTKNLQQAFEIARHEILVNPKIPTEYRAEEAAKFCLLPHHGRHDVPIFFRHREQRGTIRTKKQFAPPVMFPPPPQIHLGRQIEQFKLIQSVLGCRLVRVSGPVGVGKNDLVKTSCQYLHDRLHLVDLHEIRWVTYTYQPTRRESEHWLGRFDQIFDLVRDDSVSLETFRSESRDAFLHLRDEYYTRKLLLVLDGKELANQESATKMGIFVTLLVEGTRHVQVWIILRDTVFINTDRLSYRQEDIRIDPLSVVDTVDLFGVLFPEHLIDTKRHGIDSVEKLCELLLSSSKDLSTQRMKEIYKMLGSGIPLDIHRSSRNFSPEDIDKLVGLGKHCTHNEDLNFCSRAALAKRQKEVEKEIVEASESREFMRCQQLQSVLTELELQRQRLPDLPSLERNLEETAFKLALAVSSMKFEDAQRLNKELKRLEACVLLERQTGVAKSTDLFESDIMTTRAGIEARIRQLDNDYDAAFDEGNFDTAEKIVNESNRLKELRSSNPTKSELGEETKRLENDLRSAKKSRRIDAARMILKRLDNVRAQLKREEEAEGALGMSSGDVQTQLNRETEAEAPSTDDIEDPDKTSNGPILERTTTTTTTDPPGKIPTTLDSALQQDIPGAFRIGGGSESDSIGDDNSEKLSHPPRDPTVDQISNVTSIVRPIVDPEEWLNGVSSAADAFVGASSSSAGAAGSSDDGNVYGDGNSNSNSNGLSQGSGSGLTEAQRQRSLMQHIQLIEHAARCNSASCTSTNCRKMKNYLQHTRQCEIKVQSGGCRICKRVWTLLTIHAQKCKDPVCPIPQCIVIREKMRELQVVATTTASSSSSSTGFVPDPEEWLNVVSSAADTFVGASSSSSAGGGAAAGSFSDDNGNVYDGDGNTNSSNSINNNGLLPHPDELKRSNDSVLAQCDMSVIPGPSLIECDESWQQGGQNESTSEHIHRRLNQSPPGSFSGRQNTGQLTEKESKLMSERTMNRTQETTSGERNDSQQISHRERRVNSSERRVDSSDSYSWDEPPFAPLPGAFCFGGNNIEASDDNDANTAPSALEAYLVDDSDNALLPGRIRMEHIEDQAAIEQIIMETIRKNTVTAQFVEVENEEPVEAVTETAVDRESSERIDDDSGGAGDVDERNDNANLSPSQRKTGFGLGKMFKRWKRK